MVNLRINLPKSEPLRISALTSKIIELYFIFFIILNKIYFLCQIVDMEIFEKKNKRICLFFTTQIVVSYSFKELVISYIFANGLRTPIDEIAFTARPKINSHSQIFRYGQSIFCLPHLIHINAISFFISWIEKCDAKIAMT